MNTEAKQAWAEEWGCTEQEVPKLIYMLRAQLRARFGLESDPPLFRPSATGLWLLEKSGADLAPIPEDVRRLIMATSCQHRIEFFGAGAGEIPGFAYYDGRAMYMDCCRGLYAGPCEKSEWTLPVTLDEYRGKVGRAYVRFIIPPTWQHVGLLPVKQESATGWAWPSEPGYEGETWADLCELRFAQEQGWAIQVAGAITFAGSDPMDAWQRRLVSLYKGAQRCHDQSLARAYRAICINAIGALHNLGTYTHVDHVAEGEEAAIPAGATAWAEEGGYTVERRARAKQWKPEKYSHPEWSAATWSRCHLRVAKALLTVPRRSVLGVRGDALYLADLVGLVANIDGPWKSCAWYDDGELGRIRRKGYLPGPLPAPRTMADLTRLAREAEAASG